MYKYIANLNNGEDLAKAYFTAIGRERYGMYRTDNNADELKAKFGIGS